MKKKEGELKGTLKRLRGMRKGFYSLEDEKGRLLDPAADGERAVKLDEVIEKVEGELKKRGKK